MGRQVWAVHETQNLTIIKDTERSDLDEVENCIYWRVVPFSVKIGYPVSIWIIHLLILITWPGTVESSCSKKGLNRYKGHIPAEGAEGTGVIQAYIDFEHVLLKGTLIFLTAVLIIKTKPANGQFKDITTKMGHITLVWGNMTPVTVRRSRYGQYVEEWITVAIGSDLGLCLFIINK